MVFGRTEQGIMIPSVILKLEIGQTRGGRESSFSDAHDLDLVKQAIRILNATDLKYPYVPRHKSE